MESEKFASAAPPYVAEPPPYRPRTARVWKLFRSTQAKVAGSIQIVAAVFAAILASVGLAIHRKYEGETEVRFFASPGVWILALYINAGAFGIVAGIKKTKCPIVASMVLSILSAICTAVHLILAACMIVVGVTWMQNERYYYGFCGTPDYYWRTPPDFYDYGSGSGDMETSGSGWSGSPVDGSGLGWLEDASRQTGGRPGPSHGSHDMSGSRGRDDRHGSRSSSRNNDDYDYYNGDENMATAFVAISSLFLLAAFSQFVVAIWAAVLCCKAVCCGHAASVEAAKGDIMVVGVVSAPPADTKAPLTGFVVVVPEANAPQPTHTLSKDAYVVDDKMPYPMVEEVSRDITSPPPSYHGSGFLGGADDTVSVKSAVTPVDG